LVKGINFLNLALIISQLVTSHYPIRLWNYLKNRIFRITWWIIRRVKKEEQGQVLLKTKKLEFIGEQGLFSKG